MRAALIDALIELASEDSKLFLLTADLGFSVVERFAGRFPDRFLNVGVAEANMIGIATGLATRGFTPYCYSIASFASMRAYEQIRNGPILHDLPVRIVGIGGGFAYGHAGITHFGLEDYALGRAQPGLAVLSPCDPLQTGTAVRTMHRHPGPVYYRVGKGNDAVIPGLGGRFRLGEIETILEGSQALILTTGGIAVEAAEAGRLLASWGHPSRVAAVPCLAPLRPEGLLELIRNHSLIATVEEHYLSGGLGSLVAETMADYGLAKPLIRLGIPKMPKGVSGSPSFLRRQAGLDRQSIAETLMPALKGGPNGGPSPAFLPPISASREVSSERSP
jgi:transketolase